MRLGALAVAASILVLVATGPIAAERGRDLEGRHFERRGTGWVQVEADGTSFEVNARILTVRFRDGVERAAQDAVLAELGGVELRRAITGFVDVEIAEGRDVLDAVAAFAARPEIAVAEANTIGAYALIPNDTLYGSEWHLPQMQVDDAWDVTTGSTQVVVAVLDSGTEFTHEDLGLGVDGYRNVWLNPGEDAWSDPTNPATGNGIDDDSNGLIDDWQGWDFHNGDNNPAGTFFHGTAVAGVISSKTNNNRGVAGVAGGNGAPGVKVLLAGVGDSAPDGAILDDAILYAAASGANIIQLSLTVGQSSAIDAALATAYDSFDMTIICSSGNGGTSNVGYPSSDSHVIAVGSTGMTDLKSSFSQYGELLELAAPGENIMMLDLNNGYGTSSGTSFSSPNTSGVAALVLSLDPSMTNADLRQLLHDTAAKVGGYNYNWNPGMPGHSLELGYGRVDALAAVQAVDNAIFADGFESGDTSAWSSSTP